MFCKACGNKFVSTDERLEICPACEYAIKRLSGYVVKVVRCKDCKHFRKGNEHNPDWCVMWSPAVGHKEQCAEDGYCNWGERKDGADNE